MTRVVVLFMTFHMEKPIESRIRRHVGHNCLKSQSGKNQDLCLEILLQSTFTVSLPSFIFHLYIFPFSNCFIFPFLTHTQASQLHMLFELTQW